MITFVLIDNAETKFNIIYMINYELVCNDAKKHLPVK